MDLHLLRHDQFDRFSDELVMIRSTVDRRSVGIALRRLQYRELGFRNAVAGLIHPCEGIVVIRGLDI